MTTELGVWLQAQPSENRLHLLRHQPSYFAKGGEVGRLVAWLTDFGFLEQKLEAVGITALIDDYDLALPLIGGEEQKSLKLIQGALRLSSHVVANDWSQLAGQLLGRLLSFPEPTIQAFLEQVKQAQDQPWFRPRFPCLHSPGGALIRTLTGHSSSVTAVAITPDGKVISGSEDKTLKVWDLQTGTELLTLTGHSGYVTAVAVTPDGKVISGSEDKTLKVWDLQTGRELLTLEGHSNEVSTVAVTLDGKIVSESVYNDTLVWDLETGRKLLTRMSGRSRGLRKVNMTPSPVTLDGKVISASSNTLKVRDSETGIELFTLTEHSDEVTALAVTSDGKVISGSWDGTLKVWDLSKGKEMLDIRDQSILVRAIAMTPDGKVISGSLDTTFKVWDLHTGKKLLTFTGYNGSYGLAATPDEKMIDGSKIWDLHTGKELLTLMGHSNQVTAVVVTWDDKVISVSEDGFLNVWDLDTGIELTTFRVFCWDIDKIFAVAVTPKGKMIVGGCARYSSSSTLEVWDFQTRKEIFTLPLWLKKLVWRWKKDRILKLKKSVLILTGHSSDVFAVAVTQEGKVISGSKDKTMKVWDLETGTELFTLTGHSDSVSALAVTSDGKVISGSWDKTMKVWDLETGIELATFTADASIECCAVAADGRSVVAGDRSGRVYFLSLEGL
jgi:WD40 repeat protein